MLHAIPAHGSGTHSTRPKPADWTRPCGRSNSRRRQRLLIRRQLETGHMAMTAKLLPTPAIDAARDRTRYRTVINSRRAPSDLLPELPVDGAAARTDARLCRAPRRRHRVGSCRRRLWSRVRRGSEGDRSARCRAGRRRQAVRGNGRCAASMVAEIKELASKYRADEGSGNFLQIQDRPLMMSEVRTRL